MSGKDYFSNLKNKVVTESDAKDVRDTQQLSGGAKDSPLLTESNVTKVHKTAAPPKMELGGKDSKNG